MATSQPTNNPSAPALGASFGAEQAPATAAASDAAQQQQQQANGTAGETSQQLAPAAAAPPPPAADDPQPPLPEPRVMTRKDASLKDFLSKMDDYAPIIPDAVTNYYMTKAGLPPPPQTDQRLARLLALATQKFVADIAADAYQYSRIRGGNTSSGSNPMGSLGAAAGVPLPGAAGGAGAGAAAAGGKDSTGRTGQPLGVQRAGYGGGGQGGGQNRTVLTMEDLGMAAGEYGVNVKRSEFYR